MAETRRRLTRPLRIVASRTVLIRRAPCTGWHAGDVRSLPPVRSQRVRAERAPGGVVTGRRHGADVHVVP